MALNINKLSHHWLLFAYVITELISQQHGKTMPDDAMVASSFVIQYPISLLRYRNLDTCQAF